jgi:hypothetical protein
MDEDRRDRLERHRNTMKYKRLHCPEQVHDVAARVVECTAFDSGITSSTTGN